MNTELLGTNHYTKSRSELLKLIYRQTLTFVRAYNISTRVSTPASSSSAIGKERQTERV